MLKPMEIIIKKSCYINKRAQMSSLVAKHLVGRKKEIKVRYLEKIDDLKKYRMTSLTRSIDSSTTSMGTGSGT
jgi:hypothetical protein